MRLCDAPILPFRLNDAYGGFGEVSGLATLTPDALSLEYEICVMGLYRSRVRCAAIRLADMAAADLTCGWFRTRLTLRVATLAALSKIPGSDGGELTLRIKRRDRPAARALSSLLRLWLSQRELERARLPEVLPDPPAIVDDARQGLALPRSPAAQRASA